MVAARTRPVQRLQPGRDNTVEFCRKWPHKPRFVCISAPLLAGIGRSQRWNANAASGASPSVRIAGGWLHVSPYDAHTYSTAVNSHATASAWKISLCVPTAACKVRHVTAAQCHDFACCEPATTPTPSHSRNSAALDGGWTRASHIWDSIVTTRAYTAACHDLCSTRGQHKD